MNYAMDCHAYDFTYTHMHPAQLSARSAIASLHFLA